ncbi:MAG: Na+/proline symporter [Leptolyngbya foveolarum]|uniref:Na+/proline symporter n=1 Tax=Leptolyngbya foveolarum TaxID=47253 RepID=A0A2W4WIR1_9CYAN|nr:MAG: Na+/proline symporter [Leptolyngbya foveolarum]
MSVGAIALTVLLVAAATFALFGLVKSSNRAIDLEDYMVSRNQVGGPAAVATVTASALGAWILFSPPEAGSEYGGITAILGYCFGSALAIFTFVFVGPRLRQIMPWGHSLNEYVRYRFGAVALNGKSAGSSTGRLMYLLTVGVILLYMFVYLTAELTAIAKALQLIADVPLIVTSLVVISAVFLYTTYGGLRVTIVTDIFQFALIVPLLLICFVATITLLGGIGPALAPVADNLPELLSFNNIGGLRFGATLLIATIAAELFNQGNWQRVYACRNDATVRRSFLGAALIILPLIFLSGSLGLIAAGYDLVGATSFFDLLQSLNIANWLLSAVILLAVALVMSSLDSLLNGISAVFAGDLLRVNDGPETVLLISRGLTIAVGVPAVAIASQGYSVLYLFFVADLLCAALLFPLLLSFYNRHQTAANALVSSLIGIIVGVLFFPKPDFSPLVNIPGSGDLLNSFAAALLSSMFITLIWTSASKRSSQFAFNYSDLKEVKPYTDGHLAIEPKL